MFSFFSVCHQKTLSSPVQFYFSLFINVLIISFLYKLNIKKRILLVICITTIYLLVQFLSVKIISKLVKISTDTIIGYNTVYINTADTITTVFLLATALLTFKISHHTYTKKIFNFSTLLNVIVFITIIFIITPAIDISLLCIFYEIILIGFIVVIYADYCNFKIKLTEIKTQCDLLINENLHNTMIENEEIRKLHHDMKHYITGIKAMLEQESKDSLTHYISELETKISSQRLIKTENNALSAILNIKNSTAKQKNISIRFAVLGRIPDLSDTDIFALFGNLIDNAIEACERSQQKQVAVCIFEKGGFSHIEISNSIYDTDINFKKTSKKDKTKHGYGIKSIKDITGKYNGTFDAFNSNSKAYIRISFPL